MNKDFIDGVYTYNGEDKMFTFRISISTYNKLRFVNSVTNLVVDMSNKVYNYVIRDLVFKFNIINYFTDVDISEIEEIDRLEQTIDFMEHLVNDTNIVDIVIANAEDGLIEELSKAVDKNIEFQTGIHLNPMEEGISSLFNTIEKKFEKIDIDDLMNLAQALSSISGELTAEKLMDAYSKTDIFKNKYTKMISEREKKDEELIAVGDAVKKATKRGRKKSKPVVNTDDIKVGNEEVKAD